MEHDRIIRDNNLYDNEKTKTKWNKFQSLRTVQVCKMDPMNVECIAYNERREMQDHRENLEVKDNQRRVEV